MRHSLALFLLFTLVACSTTDDPSQGKYKPVEEMYSEAKAEFSDGSYEKAIKLYETMESRYPYGRYAQQALLEIAYSYYRQGEAELSVSAANRFIKQYPNNPYVDYAYYIKGLANFNGEITILKSVGGQDPTERDPKAAQESFDAFRDLVARFPNSKYAADSKLRMQYLLNALARYELHVANYYLRRGAHVAAANRAKSILTQYPNSPSTRDALQVLIQVYDAMGMTDLRDDTQRLFEKNTGASTPSPDINELPATLEKPGKLW
jgi:outer membrane protein assembly factor BamD